VRAALQDPAPTMHHTCGLFLGFRALSVGFMVHGLWFMNYGVRCMVHGSWFMVHDSCVLVYGLWYTLDGVRSMVEGLWGTPRSSVRGWL